MSEHKYIWLQPECCADPDEGRHWCQDPDPVECDDGKLWTKYILASEHEALERQLEDVRQSLQRAEGERDGMLPVFKMAVSLVKHWISNGRAEYLEMTCGDDEDDEDDDKSDLAELMLVEQVKKLKPLPASDVDKPEGDTNA